MASAERKTGNMEGETEQNTGREDDRERDEENKEKEEDTEREEVEEIDDVFVVNLHRGPHGIGLALVDGMKTMLKISGIYVKSVVPDSPAAHCMKLKTGDRILAVNGISLVGLEYDVGRDLIRSSADTLSLLVARMDLRPGSKDSAMTK